MPVPEDGGQLGRRPVGAPARPIRIGRAASESSTRKTRPRSPTRVARASTSGWRSSGSHWWSTPPAHIDVGVAQLRVQGLCLGLLGRVEQPVRRLARRIGEPGVLESGGREVGADHMPEAVGQEAGLGAVAAAHVHDRQIVGQQVRLEEGEMDARGQCGVRVPEDGSLLVGGLAQKPSQASLYRCVTLMPAPSHHRGPP